MRFSTTLAAAAALAPAVVSAGTYAADLKDTLGKARVHNHCDYPVYLWSVKKDQGCDEGEMKTLKTGESYEETYRDDHSDTGVSIKISDSTQCKGNDITQLEYHINHDNPDYLYNFLDVSFVDCVGGKCPGRKSLFFKSGNNGDSRLATAGADKAICPVFSCDSFESCGNPNAGSNLYDVYLNWDDRATKSCEPAADTDLYLCTSSDETKDIFEELKPSKEEKVESSEEPKPTAIKIKEKVDKVAEPKITAKPVVSEDNKPNVKTEVVYVTQIEYVNANKRHAHGHRHQHFRA